MVVTKSDGTQSIKNISDVLTDNDAINLNSYTAMNKDFDNGNTLLGTFDVTYKNKTLENAGYQTLDTQDWLDENYEFSDEAAGIGRFAQNITDAVDAVDLSDKIDDYEKKNTQLRKELNQAWEKIGFSTDEIGDVIKEASEQDAKQKAQYIEDKFENIKRDDEEESNWFFFSTDEETDETKKKKKEEEE